MSPETFSPPLQNDATVLHMAAANDLCPVVALLLATPGVDPVQRTRVSYWRSGAIGLSGYSYFHAHVCQMGDTPLDYARMYGGFTTAALLQADPRVAAALEAAEAARRV